MTVLDTQISCFHSTWNPTFGCTKVSPGCDHCYAEAIANRFHGGFELRLKPQRLTELHRFRPVEENGRRVPRIVFVNSMSDPWHDAVSDAYLDRVFDAIEAQHETIFQCITKRHRRFLRYARNRWRESGVPRNVWLGVSAENDAYRVRIEALRALKDAVGDFTALANTEPVLGPVARHDYAEIDWVIAGGESGARGRPMQREWLDQALAAARRSGAAFWFKSWGRWENNPVWPLARGKTKAEKKRDLFERGLERLPEEHGGATLDGALIQERPRAYRRFLGEQDGGG